jgi:hypothetical protein
MKKQLLLYTMAITLFLQTGLAFSINAPKDFRIEGTAPTPPQEQEEKQNQKKTNGLITEEERAEFLTRMRAAKSNEEQEQIRLEIHKIMQERAKSRGISLSGRPAEP